MKTLTKIVFRKYSMGDVTEYSSGEELEPPSTPNLFTADGMFVDPQSPNVDAAWHVENISNQDAGIYILVAWRYVAVIREPGDSDYVPEKVAQMPVIPQQRITITLDLRTHDELETPKDVTGWLGARLQDCPFGLLTLESIKVVEHPTVWDVIGKDDDDADEAGATEFG